MCRVVSSMCQAQLGSHRLIRAGSATSHVRVHSQHVSCRACLTGRLAHLSALCGTVYDSLSMYTLAIEEIQLFTDQHSSKNIILASILVVFGFLHSYFSFPFQVCFFNTHYNVILFQSYPHPFCQNKSEFISILTSLTHCIAKLTLT